MSTVLFRWRSSIIPDGLKQSFEGVDTFFQRPVKGKMHCDISIGGFLKNLEPILNLLYKILK